jgi:hypothetical protein
MIIAFTEKSMNYTFLNFLYIHLINDANNNVIDRGAPIAHSYAGGTAGDDQYNLAYAGADHINRYDRVSLFVVCVLDRLHDHQLAAVQIFILSGCPDVSYYLADKQADPSFRES